MRTAGRTACRRTMAMAAALAGLCPQLAGAAPDEVADFYRGRQLSVVVGYGPGGSASFYAQALAHHMGRYLPGNPSLVVQHLPGAGGLLAANTIFNSVFEFLFAPQDMGRPFFAPPGVPPERVRALRDAFARTLQDAQFLAEADRLGLEVQHGGGDAIDRLLERLYATPKTVLERVKAIAE
jgi:tripartite-type tricarboxylate transporter receptor subunit TctC